MRRCLAALACAAFASPLGAQGGDAPVAARTSHLSTEYQGSYFPGGIDPWHLASAALGLQTARGLFIGRVNYARRFGLDGIQFEADGYPRITKNAYLYLNAGYSADDIFPRWRSGGELFTSLPRAWEASAGYRQLRFGGAPVTLLTGSLGKYVGNSWFSARPYIRSSAGSTSASLGLQMRRYTVDADNYLGARASAGSSPTDRIDPSELSRTSSWSLGLSGSKAVRSRHVVRWSIGRESEQLPGGSTRQRWDASLGLRVDR